MKISQFYSKKVLEHVRHPQNIGEIKNPDGVATVGNPVCVSPATLILVNSKVTPIDEVCLNNRVLGHDGHYHRVIRTYKRNYSGEILSIRVHTLGEFVVTPEHHILGIKMSHISHKFEAFQKGKVLTDWFNASQLEKGDVILYPISEEVNDRDFIKFEIRKSPWDFRSKNLPEGIRIDEDFLRLAGYYLAEGYLRTEVTQKTLGFVFGQHERYFIKDVLSLMKKIFNLPPSNIRTSHNSTNLIFYRSQFVQVFQDLFGKGALDKHCPHWMMILPPEKQKALLCGLWRGDGYISKKRKSSKFVTISQQLAYQVRLLLLRQKIIFSFLTVAERGIHKKNYCIYVKEEDSLKRLAEITGVRVNFPVKKKSPHKSWFDDNFYYVPIWKIKSFKYRGLVYNLEVKDSASYVTNAATLHNCGDIMRLYIKVEKRKKKEYIKDIKFQTLGCGAALATSSMITTMVKGKPLSEAEKITNQAIADALGGLPVSKIHCSLLAAEALEKAIANYRQKTKK